MTERIRRLGPDDWEAYREIRLEALIAHPEAFLSTPEGFAALDEVALRQLLGKMAFFAGVTADGRLLGLMAFDIGQGPRQAHRGSLYQVYVRPEARGTGLAQRLLDSVFAHAADRVSQIHLNVAAGNEPAIRLYERNGFRRYGTEPRYLYVNGRYVDEHLMVRFLDEASSSTRHLEKKND